MRLPQLQAQPPARHAEGDDHTPIEDELEHSKTAVEIQEPSPSGVVNITTIFYDGAGSQEPDEYVETKNDDTKPIQLQNWTLSDAANHVFTFPSFVFQPGQVCRVYTNEVHPEWCGFSYGSGSAIWNNSGDTATLRDGNGTVVDSYTYP
jgi:hypothetical protein